MRRLGNDTVNFCVSYCRVTEITGPSAPVFNDEPLAERTECSRDIERHLPCACSSDEKNIMLVDELYKNLDGAAMCYSEIEEYMLNPYNWNKGNIRLQGVLQTSTACGVNI